MFKFWTMFLTFLSCEAPKSDDFFSRFAQISLSLDERHTCLIELHVSPKKIKNGDKNGRIVH